MSFSLFPFLSHCPTQWKSVPLFPGNEYTMQQDTLAICIQVVYAAKHSTLLAVSGRMSTIALRVNTRFCGGYFLWTDFNVAFRLRVVLSQPTWCCVIPG